jgi:hypothetical protein
MININNPNKYGRRPERARQADPSSTAMDFIVRIQRPSHATRAAARLRANDEMHLPVRQHGPDEFQDATKYAACLGFG